MENIKNEENEFNIEIVTTITLNEQDIVDMFCDAFGGGAINYWGSIYSKKTNEAYEEYKKEHPEYDCWDESMGHFLVDGGVIYIRDDEEGKNYELTIDSFLKGIKLNSQNRPWDCDYENYDATTIDCIIQYSLFDDIIYG